MAEPLEQLRKIRISKLAALRQLGIDAYPAKCSRKQTIAQARQKMGKTVMIAGRLRAKRGHGGIQFFDLEDESGKIQLVFKKEELKAKDLKLLALLDIGDFVEVWGGVFQTQAGEISVLVKFLKLLTKSLRPLPSKWYGLKDEEERLRRRYLDLIFNPELHEVFRKKALFWNTMRSFLLEKGFLEVETPVLEVTAGGADANPFITHHDALDCDVYLRISMGELWQKRLMVAGFEKTFEIGRQFRNEGLSKEHLQDYTQMEFYWAYADYEDGMKLVEEMYREVIEKTFGTLKFEIFGFKIDFGKPWSRIDYREAVLKKFKIEVNKTNLAEVKKKLDQLKVDYDKKASLGRLIDCLWKEARKDISGPAFLVGHPVLVSPLAKRVVNKPTQTQRFQVIIAGSEVGNGYSELNDPLDQAERFLGQAKMRAAGDKLAQMYDTDFVEALEFGMPPTCGFGVSERLFSFLMNRPIRECVLFPLMKPR
jgi:lysyl-tRNA synthetase class 2